MNLRLFKIYVNLSPPYIPEIYRSPRSSFIYLRLLCPRFIPFLMGWPFSYDILFICLPQFVKLISFSGFPPVVWCSNTPPPPPSLIILVSTNVIGVYVSHDLKVRDRGMKPSLIRAHFLTWTSINVDVNGWRPTLIGELGLRLTRSQINVYTPPLRSVSINTGVRNVDVD